MDNKSKYLNQAIHGLEKTYPQYSMRLFLEKISNPSKTTKVATYLALTIVLTMVMIFPKIIGISLFILLSVLYSSVQLFKLALVVIAASSNRKAVKHIIPDELPIYSILLPVYHEDKVLPQLIDSIKQLDYPTHLLDVKLLIEEDDRQTLKAVRKIRLPKFIEIIKIPVEYPKTKPKACNYGLQFTKGKYITIYDAEDRPDPKQLKQVVAKFTASDEKVVCIQAKLSFYNKAENLLTKLFELDYGLLFDYLLPGLKKINMSIPLGGTSNHFIREKLITLGGWDAFNVTEDADLGIRIAQQGYQTGLINSITLEEAPITLKSWLIQRSRWIKGHILTSMLHLKVSIGNLSFKQRFGLYFALFLPNLSYPLIPIYILLHFMLTENYCLNLLWQLNIYLGIAMPIVYALLITYAKKWNEFKLVVFAAPFYYALLSIAAIRAVIEIFKRPFYWDKTNHGVSKQL